MYCLILSFLILESFKLSSSTNASSSVFREALMPCVCIGFQDLPVVFQNKDLSAPIIEFYSQVSVNRFSLFRSDLSRVSQTPV